MCEYEEAVAKLSKQDELSPPIIYNRPSNFNQLNQMVKLERLMSKFNE